MIAILPTTFAMDVCSYFNFSPYQYIKMKLIGGEIMYMYDVLHRTGTVTQFIPIVQAGEHVITSKAYIHIHVHELTALSAHWATDPAHMCTFM